jgi:phosphoribosylformimino-5-aminoimidazole carboxamide ribonucleotide (ProFAR) isomerase
LGFLVIPAIDVHGGSLARYTPDGPAPVEAFGRDPLLAARTYLAAGATWVHVVDMDRAFTGVAQNLDVVASVADLGLRVQAAGGVTSAMDVEGALSAGAARVVLGSGAFLDMEATAGLIEVFGDRLVAGVEVEGGRIRARGRIATDLPIDETLSALATAGAARFLVTSIPRVGSLGGPDLETARGAVGTGRPVLAAGGIATLEHLAALRDLGVEGAVVGRAPLEGGLDLAAAIASFA